jgi:hypothetical protein
MYTSETLTQLAKLQATCWMAEELKFDSKQRQEICLLPAGFRLAIKGY